VLKLLKTGGVLGIFPQGTRVKSEEQDSAKAGLGMFSLKTNTPIIPVRIEGNYKLFSKLTINIFDIYEIPDQYKDVPNQENYMNISNEIMKIIKS
jgi:1-acyl-sn-glycerol-3-phosphate acyltransferase